MNRLRHQERAPTAQPYLLYRSGKRQRINRDDIRRNHYGGKHRATRRRNAWPSNISGEPTVTMCATSVRRPPISGAVIDCRLDAGCAVRTLCTSPSSTLTPSILTWSSSRPWNWRMPPGNQRMRSPGAVKPIVWVGAERVGHEPLRRQVRATVVSEGHAGAAERQLTQTPTGTGCPRSSNTYAVVFRMGRP